VKEKMGEMEEREGAPGWFGIYSLSYCRRTYMAVRPGYFLFFSSKSKT
jgi:hypothetical protein